MWTRDMSIEMGIAWALCAAASYQGPVTQQMDET